MVLDSELFEEPLRQLLQPLIARFRSFVSDRSDVRFESCIPPIKARRLLCIARHAVARGFQQRSRCRGVEARIIARRQVELTPRSTGIVPIIVDKGP